MKILNPKREDIIYFQAMDELTGTNEQRRGKVVGKGVEIRKLYPVEMALAPENYLLVEEEIRGLKSFYVVTPEDVDRILPIPKEA